LERTAHGSTIADRIRDGEVHITLTRESIGGMAGWQRGRDVQVAWQGSIQETASKLIHEGAHFIDNPFEGEVGASPLQREGIARTFEYEYRQVAGLPPYDEAEEAYRQAYSRALVETGDVGKARQVADRALLAAMRADPQRFAVESSGGPASPRPATAKQPKDLLTRTQAAFRGRFVDSKPLETLWNRARQGLTITPSTSEETARKIFNEVRGRFWAEVNTGTDPIAAEVRQIIELAGYELQGGNRVPILQIQSFDVRPGREQSNRILTIDHDVALTSKKARALDVDNLRFMAGWDNSWKGARVITPSTRGRKLKPSERAEVAALRQKVDLMVASRQPKKGKPDS
jgi:hypothetical protein